MKTNKLVRLMGVINLSPESFFKGSVPSNKRALMDMAKRMEDEGADLIDIGAMSTAPYLDTRVSEDEEERRLSWGVEAVARASRLPISIDTARYRPAKAGLEAGAQVLNDVTGLRGDPKLLPLLVKFRSLVLMAHPQGLKKPKQKNPISAVRHLLQDSLRAAVKAGMPASRIILDPGIGFFRDTGIPWWTWDLAVLRDLEQLQSLGRPILAGVSRKSFIGKALGLKNPEDRLAGFLAATTVAVLNGATLIRTHDIKATWQAVRLAEEFL